MKNERNKDTMNLKIKIGEIEFECSGSFDDVNYQKKEFYKKLSFLKKILANKENNEKDIDYELKQLLECSVKKLQFPKDIEDILEENRIKCIEDLLELSTKFLESINLTKPSIKKIDDVLDEYDLYREMKYSQIELPESILSVINLNYDIKKGK